MTYQPARLSREALLSGFTARQPLLEELLRILRAGRADVPHQHVLVVGGRGMGKSMLLLRTRHAVEEDADLRHLWEPVVFPEENYNIGDLAELWLTTLRALSATSGDPGPEETAERLLRETHDEALLEARALDALRARAKSRGRGLLLLLDNFDLLLGQLTEEAQQWRLRELLMSDPSFLLVGAASSYLGTISEYDKPFYDFFRELRLKELDRDELFELLRRRAKGLGDTGVLGTLERNPGRVCTLHRLAGGNPRLALLGYRLLREAPGGTAADDLEGLLEELTPHYKQRLEALPDQQRRVFDAVARSWDPVTARAVAERTRLPVTSASTQLSRLVERRYVEEVGVGGARKGFQAAERLFNLYALMRLDRSGGQRLAWLARFMEVFYDAEPARLADPAPERKPRKSLLRRLRKEAETLRLMELAGRILARKHLGGPPGRAVLLRRALDLLEPGAVPERAATAEALRELEESLRQEPDWAAGLLAAALLSDAGGDRPRAARLATQAVELEPKNKHARRLRSALLEGDWRETLAQADRLLRDKNGTDPMAALESLCEVAASGHAREAAELLDERGASGPLEPLRHALAVASGEDPHRLRWIAAEVAGVAAEVLAVLRRRGPAAHPEARSASGRERSERTPARRSPAPANTSGRTALERESPAGPEDPAGMRL